MTEPVGGPQPGEDELVEKVTAALWPDLGDRLTATRAVRVVLDEQARLRVTAPAAASADRPDPRRDAALADIAGEAARLERQTDVDSSWRAVRLRGWLDALRAPARPADESVVKAARALIELHDDPMLCNTGGPRTAAAIDAIRQALAAAADAVVTPTEQGRDRELAEQVRELTHLTLTIDAVAHNMSRDGHDGCAMCLDGPVAALRALRDRLRTLLTPTAPGLTREQVIEAVREELTVSKVDGGYVADRLGLSETTGEARDA